MAILKPGFTDRMMVWSTVTRYCHIVEIPRFGHRAIAPSSNWAIALCHCEKVA
ncbi:MAG: hypothetical protein IGR76_03110 [Synechococcales cyanobacterium T60_A2020_003]|nr:hypothetical protein [Synechococcales cyanobacterium T60_A2020_003]